MTSQERHILHSRLRNLQGVAVIAFAILGVCAAAGPATAAEAAGDGVGTTSGTAAPEARFVSGGVSLEERDALQARREAFNLWVITAARKSGAYMAQVRVKVSDAQQRVVYDGELEGPWLFIDLPLGRYLIEARLGDQIQHRSTTIHPGDHHQAVFYFDVDADMLPAGGQAGQAAGQAAGSASR